MNQDQYIRTGQSQLRKTPAVPFLSGLLPDSTTRWGPNLFYPESGAEDQDQAVNHGIGEAGPVTQDQDQ